jgi:hypothetical protein
VVFPGFLTLRDILDANSHGWKVFSMQELRVIGVDGGALLVAAEDGTRFRIPVDEVLQARLRQTTTAPSSGTERKLTPREIQGHIRAGMSADDVAAITGAELEYIQRFEGPVLAEREFVVESALGIAVHTAADTDPLSQARSFGEVIRERLHELGAIGERWASWKEDGTGWIVKLAFTSDQVDHDARWSFDPKRQALAPLNSEAITLSQQGGVSGPLIPRLRAVARTEPPEHARFDSGAFATTDDGATEPQLEPVAFGRTAPAKEPESTGTQTADLLDALRRRRGEREAAAFGDEDDARAAHPSTGSIRLIDVPLPEFELEPEPAPRTTAPQPIGRGSRKGRAAMPSWDEIVFGTRTDDDPA